jgi:ribonuclease VapC
LRAFVDASFIVAIIAREPECDAFIERLLAAGERLWSAMSCWETVSGLRNNYRLSIDEARDAVGIFQQAFEMKLVPIAASELATALDAYRDYGKGQQRPGRLNFGDCFAYACAKTNAAKLFYKGDDFAKTDLA